jgi:hypothetical protein
LLRSDSAGVATILPDALAYTITLFGKWQKDMELAETVYTDGLLPTLGITGKTPYNYASDVLLKNDMPAPIAETVFITSNSAKGTYSRTAAVRVSNR